MVADVRTLDKKQGSFKQVTSTAAKQDLVISAYKPNHGLEERFKLEAGTEDGVWDFVRTHMRQLPVFVSKDGQAEAIAERQNFLLFDRMVAFHVQRGVTIPVSAAEFYAVLTQRFSERDGMYFLPEQVAEYDRKRMTVKDVLQLDLFVKDEETATQWLKQQLTKKPQTFQEIHPHFMKELGGWDKHEKSLELLDLLQENFLRYDGAGEVPSQIHSYLSSNFKELRSLEKGDTGLRAKAKDRWYVPDPRKAIDLEKLRERALLREFEGYRDGTEKKLKVFPPRGSPRRLQAGVAGAGLCHHRCRRSQDPRERAPGRPETPPVVRPRGDAQREGHMIKQWKLFDFKSVRSETDLAFAPLTIFAGPNSSGKSTVIQSILLVAQTLAHKVELTFCCTQRSLDSLGAIRRPQDSR